MDKSINLYPESEVIFMNYSMTYTGTIVAFLSFVAMKFGVPFFPKV